MAPVDTPMESLPRKSSPPPVQSKGRNAQRKRNKLAQETGELAPQNMAEGASSSSVNVARASTKLAPTPVISAFEGIVLKADDRIWDRVTPSGRRSEANRFFADTIRRAIKECGYFLLDPLRSRPSVHAVVAPIMKDFRGSVNPLVQKFARIEVSVRAEVTLRLLWSLFPVVDSDWDAFFYLALAYGIRHTYRVPRSQFQIPAGPGQSKIPAYRKKNCRVLIPESDGAEFVATWENAVEAMLEQASSPALLAQGGIVWRLALEFSRDGSKLVQDYLNGPSYIARIHGSEDCVAIGLETWVQDSVLEGEIDLLVGVSRNRGKDKSGFQSLWPTPEILLEFPSWRATQMWTDEMESMFQEILTMVRSHAPFRRNAHTWKLWLKARFSHWKQTPNVPENSWKTAQEWLMRAGPHPEKDLRWDNVEIDSLPIPASAVNISLK